MASLADLWTSLFPAAVTVAPLPAGAAEREVGWVRVLKARVPAFDGLDAGDLAILPAGALAAVAPGPADRVALVAGFVRASVAGLLLVDGDGVGIDTGPDREAASPSDAFGPEAARAGLAVLRVAGMDPTALERSAIGFLVNRRAELDRQASLMEARLEALALEGSDLAGLVGAIGVGLGRAVALEGRRGDALAVHAPPNVPGAAAAVGAYLARPRSVALRLALPAAPTGASGGGKSGGARSSGSLALLGERPVSELERVVGERIAVLLALELARDESVHRARDTVRRGDSLPADGPPWVVLLADQAPPAADASLDQREDLRRELRLMAPARRVTLRGDATSLELRAVLAAGDDDPGALALADRIGRFLGRTVALSRPFSDPGDRPSAEAEARSTLEAARTVGGPIGVARADRLAAYRLLGALHNLPDGLRQARALLEPLLGGRADVRVERLATLRAILDHPGAAEAAASLGIHRNTIAYRIRRMEAASGWSLDEPDLRLALSVAVRLAQTAQE
jgi:PucR C-terminal helix-turn-helix domain